jgi:hypothetical protein
MLPGNPASSTAAAPDGVARRAAYGLLIVAAASVVAARVLHGPPVFSVNDQSRWSTIRALVDNGTYSIGWRYERIDGSYRDIGIVSEDGWRTVDMVMEPVNRRFYSTKPTLLPTILAGEYWLLREVFGWQITSNRRAVARTILLTVNWLPLVIYLVLLSRLAERMGTTDWGRLFVVTTAAFGTFVSGFQATLNNHTVAACGALFAIYQVLKIHIEGDGRWWRFVLAGLFAGWTACNELPAAALAAGLFVWLASLSPRGTLRIALPAAALPVAAYLYTQYEAFGSILPTYARTEWYLFEGSYWRNPRGIDNAQESTRVYAFNLLAGHTGILSLSPVLLLGWIGVVRGVMGAKPRLALPRLILEPRQWVAWLALTLTLITFTFYVIRTNNYGGISAGPRWFFWLIPLWLVGMLPEADRWSASRPRRALAVVLLALSVGSAMYALENPWRHSWLFDVLRDFGVVSY